MTQTTLKQRVALRETPAWLAALQGASAQLPPSAAIEHADIVARLVEADRQALSRQLTCADRVKSVIEGVYHLGSWAAEPALEWLAKRMAGRPFTDQLVDEIWAELELDRQPITPCAAYADLLPGMPGAARRAFGLVCLAVLESRDSR